MPANTNDAVLDTVGSTRTEAGVNERTNQQGNQGDRSFYAGAFHGDTPIGKLNGNYPAWEPQVTGPSPIVNTRGRR